LLPLILEIFRNLFESIWIQNEIVMKETRKQKKKKRREKKKHKKAPGETSAQ
jgi:hypothetical protein